MTLRLYKWQAAGWDLISEQKTDSSGNVSELYKQEFKGEQLFRIVFETEAWFSAQKRETLYPYISIELKVKDEPNYHIPLLINSFGYSTYRGS